MMRVVVVLLLGRWEESVLDGLDNHLFNLLGSLHLWAFALELLPCPCIVALSVLEKNIRVVIQNMTPADEVSQQNLMLSTSLIVLLSDSSHSSYR